MGEQAIATRVTYDGRLIDRSIHMVWRMEPMAVTLDERLASAYVKATNEDRHDEADLYLSCRELVRASTDLARAVLALSLAKEVLHLCREEP